MCLLCCGLAACHDDDDGEPVGKGIRKVYFMNSESGPGDNGYNDLIMKAEMVFSMLHPDYFVSFIGISELLGREDYYKLLTALPTQDDSILVVLNGSDYSETVRKTVSISTYNEMTQKYAKDMRVLLFEDDGRDVPEHVYTFSIQRYGASYVAARLLGKKPALVVAAMKGEPQLDSAVQGFIDGYSVENSDGPIVAYLSDDFSGFDMPDRAVQICDSVIKSFPKEQLAYRDNEFDEGLCIFPLAGGSNVGMYAYVHSLPYSWNVNIIGMDDDYCDTSYSIPFSLVLPVYVLVEDYLEMWADNKPWPLHESFGLSSSYPIMFALSTITFPHFLSRFNPHTTAEYPDEDSVFQRKLDEFIEEAREKEKEYEQKLRGEKK